MNPPDGEFVLDRVDNPHPRMLERALNLRRVARAAPGEPLVFLPWQGYFECMCDATGEPPEAITAWLDSHDPMPDPSPVQHREPTATGTPVPVQLVTRTDRTVAELKAQLAYWENAIGPCRNCGWSPDDDDDAFDRLVALIAPMPEALRLRTALAYSICPIHLCDYAICFDDQNPECVAIRTEHPEHDT